MNKLPLMVVIGVAVSGCGAAPNESEAIGSVSQPMLGAGTFEEVASFGGNPGGLKMYVYTPSVAPAAGAGAAAAAATAFDDAPPRDAAAQAPPAKRPTALRPPSLRRSARLRMEERSLIGSPPELMARRWRRGCC